MFKNEISDWIYEAIYWDSAPIYLSEAIQRQNAFVWQFHWNQIWLWRGCAAGGCWGAASNPVLQADQLPAHPDCLSQSLLEKLIIFPSSSTKYKTWRMVEWLTIIPGFGLIWIVMKENTEERLVVSHSPAWTFNISCEWQPKPYHCKEA